MPDVILHHYDMSPYAEKIRAILAHAELPWQSMLSPVMPPRPNVDPLSGGYRKIPIMQLGADIICDSTLIADELAALSGRSCLDRHTLSEANRALIDRAEQEIFFAVPNSQHPAGTLWTLLKSMGPLGTLRFVKDRGSMMKGTTVRMRSREKSKAMLDSFFNDLEQLLQANDYLGGESPNLTDFAVYNPVWFFVVLGGNSLPASCPKLARWFATIQKISSRSPRTEITQADAFAAAMVEPRALPEGSAVSDSGGQVSIGPSDYGTDRVSGELVAETEQRWIIRRATERFGDVHVHFPKRGFAIER